MAIDPRQTLERFITLIPHLPDEARRSLADIFCEVGLMTITRLVEKVGDAQHPVNVATMISDVALKAGHADVLNKALAKVDISWPAEIVVAFLAATASAADELPEREALWQRFESSVLPR